MDRLSVAERPRHRRGAYQGAYRPDHVILRVLNDYGVEWTESFESSTTACGMVDVGGWWATSANESLSRSQRGGHGFKSRQLHQYPLFRAISGHPVARLIHGFGIAPLHRRPTSSSCDPLVFCEVLSYPPHSSPIAAVAGARLGLSISSSLGPVEIVTLDYDELVDIRLLTDSPHPSTRSTLALLSGATKRLSASCGKLWHSCVGERSPGATIHA